jgi:hypothetical protein
LADIYVMALSLETMNWVADMLGSLAWGQGRLMIYHLEMLQRLCPAIAMLSSDHKEIELEISDLYIYEQKNRTTYSGSLNATT